MAKEENQKDLLALPSNGLPDAASSSRTQWIAVLCDEEPDRRALISEVIADVGGAIRAVHEFVQPPTGQLLSHALMTLVAAGKGTPPNHPRLAAMTAGRNAGLTVIAYEDGVKHWPVRAKCLPLLAGAAHLLDSGCAEFASELRQILEQTLRALTQARRKLQETRATMRGHGLVGESPAITEIFRTATRFSQLSDLPVLLTGESGTGKELLARAIGAMDSKRKDGPFVAINCAAINPTLMESDFFGHRRGAFTGAERERQGLIRAAEGGVLFLDEIGELDLTLQAKLLRVLQENRVLTVGDERETSVNVRFVAATNRNLEQLVAEGRFRGDLLHRLRVLSLHIPPLRERLDDIPALVGFFLQKHHALRSESAAHASSEFLDAVLQLDLPGNARELENLVCHSLAHNQTGCLLGLNDLPLETLCQLTGRGRIASPVPTPIGTELRTDPRQWPQTELNEWVKRLLDGQGWNLSGVLRECERQVFQAALERTHGNQSQTARLLGVTARSVYNKIHKLRLHV